VLTTSIAASRETHPTTSITHYQIPSALVADQGYLFNPVGKDKGGQTQSATHCTGGWSFGMTA